VFSNVNINLIFIAAGSGYGVAVDNKTGKRTYMKMGEAGIGFGAGVKDFRSLFVFENQRAMDNFMNFGWQVGANADAAAKAGDKGAALGKEAVVDGISVYQLTENGVALQATVKGAKFWVDEDLN
jgi:lipid-binding SYLF domain-containing protein